MSRICTLLHAHATSSMKNLAKATLCGVYKYSGAMYAHEALARTTSWPFMVILLFHRVTDAIAEDDLTVNTRRFRGICRMLRDNFHVVPLSEIFRLHKSGEPIPRRTVAITFDDSYRDNLFAAHVLAEHQLPACFFVPTGFVGTDQVFEWDRGLTSMPNLTWDDVREMANLGFEIGSHTVTHCNMADVSVDEARRELSDSKSTLEDRLGRPVKWFAYPFGGRQNFGPERLPLVTEAGYEGCVSAFGGFVYPHLRESILPREAVPFFRSILNLELHLTGCLHWVYAIKRRAGLL
jgi:peptidoglycan/xylan/chitin deacetylase (PgdA/CDA1 family)